ncbi:MAG TPA: hypothetical protein VIS96_10860 [Terrimicrobiaceae bacterium]
MRTIFSIYQIWLTEEEERIAAGLREICEVRRTKTRRMEKSSKGEATGRADEFEHFQLEANAAFA